MSRNFVPRGDRAEDVAPDFLRGLHLAGDLVGPFVRHVAVRAPARTPDRLVKWIVPCSSSNTLVRISWQLTQNAVGVRRFQHRVEAAPEHDAHEEAAKREEGEAECAGRRQGGPDQGRSEPAPGTHLARTRRRHGAACGIRRRHQRLLRPPGWRSGSVSASMSVKRFSTSGRASVCGTWQARQA